MEEQLISIFTNKFLLTIRKCDLEIGVTIGVYGDYLNMSIVQEGTVECLAPCSYPAMRKLKSGLQLIETWLVLDEQGMPKQVLTGRDSSMYYVTSQEEHLRVIFGREPKEGDVFIILLEGSR